ncbi:helix-turn-helix domain-containing protein [Lysinibacillus sp. BW-2-10]|uniref:helix-turn-helix domain-containing protein n=1 Tax=Lysinibacillus sp. BW-2-10 TaxID=2590030 RepID=UPI00117EC6E6|nr:helix-turn-helix domain-containing protein [Lysinibacillus sp. BW-2-10]TSI07644.1 helix-turn-helix domain-containing protein [Lysinibacillus sp. BW-2-10]
MVETEVKKMLQHLFDDLAINLEKKFTSNKQWMTLKEGASYAGVSYNTLMKFRLMGLKICEIDGIKRVSKAEIDNFLKENSF